MPEIERRTLLEDLTLAPGWMRPALSALAEGAYLNCAREHWALPGENPPVGLILCASKGTALAHYTLDLLAEQGA